MEEKLESSSNDNGYQELTPKRSKIHHQDEQESSPDRLSELPEHLLVEIISFLEMKDAVKTSALSKTWKHLWTHVDKIVYEFDDRQPTAKLPEFISFVHRTLMQCTCPNLKKFALSVYNGSYGHQLLDEWLQWVFKKNLKFLKLDLLLEYYCLPEWFYHSSSLVKLEINVNTPWWHNGETVSWTSLKSLQLFDVSIGDEQIAILLSGCPVLETIVLYRHVAISYLNIKSPSVRSLKLTELSDDGFLESLEVDSPCLKELECKRVKIRSPLLEYELLGIACLLNTSPDLDTLIVEVVTPDEKYFHGSNGQILYSTGDKHMIFMKWNLSNLKNVKVAYCKNMCRGVAIENGDKKCSGFELVICLLKNAPALETLVITSTDDDHCKCSGDCGLRYVSSFSDDIIHTYLDGNEDCEWELRKNKSCFEFRFVKSCDKSKTLCNELWDY
ncbi:hypothetical protein DH2020_038723 [Rehmannia glutinosa]|uniref:F-box domain-containing protein n=1 Tax=Rehmannia glutinosa TaxID=99300 RepID=A0ABR0UXR8_REHGL